MPNSYEVLSQVSGLPLSEMKSIWEQVKANAATLDACAGPHDFQRLEERLLSKYRCTRCGGTVDGTDKLWYERGLKHGKDPFGA